MHGNQTAATPKARGPASAFPTVPIQLELDLSSISLLGSFNAISEWQYYVYSLIEYWYSVCVHRFGNMHHCQTTTSEC